MPRFKSSSQITPTNWLGLAWVYSGILWIVPVWLGWTGGSAEQAILAFVRMAATVVVGIGICANERWAWATALALCCAYVMLGATLLGVLAVALFSRPVGALSWQSVLWGLTAEQCNQIAVGAGTVLAVSVVALALLWQARGVFDVPHRQVYGSIVRFGLAPALAILALDGALLLAWA